jgi:chromosome partitioning protein
MKVVVLISTKGGVGKSTLAEALAVEAAKGERVFIVDIDPQQSTAAWWRRRKGPENPMLVTNVSAIRPALDAIAKRKAERDWLIIDTPGSNMNVLRDAVNHADVVVGVIQASGKDIEAQGAAQGLIQDAGKRDRTLWVVNRASKGNKLAQDAAERIGKSSVVPPVLISDRVDHVRADLVGKTAGEVNKDAAREISALWQAVKRIAQ